MDSTSLLLFMSQCNNILCVRDVWLFIFVHFVHESLFRDRLLLMVHRGGNSEGVDVVFY